MSFPIIHEIFDVSFLLTCVDVKQWSNLMRLRHPRGLDEDIVELVVALGQLDNLVNQIVLESNIILLTIFYRVYQIHIIDMYFLMCMSADLQSAADAAILHPYHGLVRLYQRRVVDQTLVDVELGHVVDNDGGLEILHTVLSLEDVLQQSCLAGPEKPAEQGDGHQGIVLKERKNIK